MRSTSTRIVIAASLVAAALAVSMDAAAAKILPVASVAVVTPRPTTGGPIEVALRFAKGTPIGFGDAPWENFEVSVIPKSRADANGWPLDIGDRGFPVPLRYVGQGVFHGSVVIDQPGDYVVVDWSSVYARDDRLAGVATLRRYPAPVRLRVNDAASPSARGVVHGDAWAVTAASITLWFAIAALLFVIVAVVAFPLRHVRSHRGGVATPSNA